jgi:hypothetical protein
MRHEAPVTDKRAGFRHAGQAQDIFLSLTSDRQRPKRKENN